MCHRGRDGVVAVWANIRKLNTLKNGEKKINATFKDKFEQNRLNKRTNVHCQLLAGLLLPRTCFVACSLLPYFTFKIKYFIYEKRTCATLILVCDSVSHTSYHEWAIAYTNNQSSLECTVSIFTANSFRKPKKMRLFRCMHDRRRSVWWRSEQQ